MRLIVKTTDNFCTTQFSLPSRKPISTRPSILGGEGEFVEDVSSLDERRSDERNSSDINDRTEVRPDLASRVDVEDLHLVISCSVTTRQR